MHSPHIALSAIAWLIGIAWLYKLLEAGCGLASVPNLLAREYDVVPGGTPSLIVIVPARNEAADVATCLESLLNQDYGNLRVFGVDDRSTDRTGAIMGALAREHTARLEVLTIRDLPANWLGKTHAMALAAQQAIAAHNPDYLLFTDADIVFQPDAIRRSLAYVVATQADHFVVLPTTVTKTFGEGMLMAFVQLISLWAVRPWRVADPKARRDAIGVGAFNLLRATVYQQLGGFDAIPMEILEDLTLGRRVKRAGFRQRVAIAPGMVCVHWAAGVYGIVNGMTKNMFAVFRFSPALLLAGAAWIMLFCIAPIAFLGLPGTRIPALMALASVAGVYVLSSRSSRISPMYSVLFPVGATLVVYSMLRSMLITMLRGGVTWRGTFYSLRELRKHMEGPFFP